MLSGMPVLVLVVAVFAVSISAPLIRLSEAHPLVIATWRLGFAMAVIAAILLLTGGWRQWRSLTRKEFSLAAGAGVLLALHFWAWNASVGLTTIAASVVLVNTQPLFVAAFSAATLGERPSPRQWAGILVAVAGAAFIAFPDLVATGTDSLRARALLGDLLAIVGAVTVAGYYVTGRHLRRKLDLWPYVGLVYGSCFLTLLALAASAGVGLGNQPPREIAIFAALAAGPMLLGHTGINYALRFAPAYLVNLPLLGEPVLATVAAALIPALAEVPPVSTVAGGLIVLAGILIASRRAG
jgi:drug/metabolite transporter (DMT)-like permease